MVPSLVSVEVGGLLENVVAANSLSSPDEVADGNQLVLIDVVQG